MNTLTKIKQDVTYAYAPLFILAFLFCVVGSSLWPLSLYFNLNIENVNYFHKLFMIGGFLTSFAYGFFLTTFTSFTRTKKIKLYYLLLIILAEVLIFLGLLINNIMFSLIAYCLCNLLAIVFVANRYMNKVGDFPKSFYFVFVSLFYGFIYFGGLVLSLYLNRDFDHVALSTLLYVMIPMNFVLGVGLKLIPVFFGVPTRSCFSISSKKKSLFSLIKENFDIFLVVLFNLTIIFDFFLSVFVGGIVRVLLLSLIFKKFFYATSKPKVKSFITLGMWFSLWTMILGLILSLFDVFSLFGFHLYFLGGVTTFTLMVAGRMTLAHGGFSLDFERKNTSIFGVVLFGALSAFLRFLPSVVSKISYDHFIFWSWICLIISIFIWFKVYGVKLFAPLRRRIK